MRHARLASLALGAAAVAALAAPPLGGCLRSTAYTCDSSAACVRGGVTGTCEADGYCSFPDTSCASGRRYGDLSGPRAGTCVGGDLPTGDGGVDGPGGVDTDGDTIPDATDNCPAIANPDQGNEDADALGDACDPCPPDPDNTDGDGDGVGDKCDPHPATPGDQLALFEGFHAGVPAGWRANGTWTASGDSVEVDVPQSTDAWLGTTTTARKQTVTARATLVASNSTFFSVLALIDNQQATSTVGIACAIVRGGAQSGLPGINVATYDPTDLAGAQTVGFEMVVGTTYDLVETRADTNYACRVSRPGATESITGQYTLDNNPRQSGAYVRGARAQYHWLMIVTSP